LWKETENNCPEPDFGYLQKTFTNIKACLLYTSQNVIRMPVVEARDTL